MSKLVHICQNLSIYFSRKSNSEFHEFFDQLVWILFLYLLNSVLFFITIWLVKRFSKNWYSFFVKNEQLLYHSCLRFLLQFFATMSVNHFWCSIFNFWLCSWIFIGILDQICPVSRRLQSQWNAVFKRGRWFQKTSKTPRICIAP